MKLTLLASETMKLFRRTALSGSSSKDDILTIGHNTVKVRNIFTTPLSLSSGKKTRGWVLRPLSGAIHVINTFTSFEHAMKWVVEHPDSDTDTNAAIAGGLLGAHLGLQNMIAEPSTVYNVNLLMNAAGTNGIPPEFNIGDFMNFTQQLYNTFIAR